MKNKYVLPFALSISLLFTNAASAENSDSAATPQPTAKPASALKLSDDELDALVDLLIERLAILRNETSADSVETASDAIVQDSSDGEEKSAESTANKVRKHSRSKVQATADASSNHNSAAQPEINNSSEEESSDTTTKDRRSHRHRKHRGGKPTAEKKNRPAESKTSVSSSASAVSKD